VKGIPPRNSEVRRRGELMRQAYPASDRDGHKWGTVPERPGARSSMGDAHFLFRFATENGDQITGIVSGNSFPQLRGAAGHRAGRRRGAIKGVIKNPARPRTVVASQSQ